MLFSRCLITRFLTFYELIKIQFIDKGSQKMNTLLTAFSLLLGLAVGSFLNVVILRLPKEDTSIVFPGSHCPQCDHPLSWWENIPLLSYLILKGQCRSCKAKISWQYPLVEAAMACFSLLLFQRFGVSMDFCIQFVFQWAMQQKVHPESSEKEARPHPEIAPLL